MKLFIDSDILVYRIGFGFEGANLYTTLDGLEIAVKGIKDTFPDHEPILALSNTLPTFRHIIAVTCAYKGNRKQQKPTFYNELREHLLEMGAVLSPKGFEADDYMGMNVNRKTDIIATIDKDLFMIPAKLHYNFVKDERVKIKRPAYYFWKQMLIGDKADNIKGLWLIGEKRASDILDGLKTSEMREAVEGQYKREFGDNWFERFNENGRLLWIKRHPDREYFDYV